MTLYPSTREKPEHVTAGFVRRTSRWGLTVNVSKTKGMTFGDGLSVADIASLQTDSGEIKMVSNFTYTLGQWCLVMVRSWKIFAVGWLKPH